MSCRRKVIRKQVVSYDDVSDIIRSLKRLHLEFDLEKRYTNERRRDEHGETVTVGIASYVLRVYDASDDARTRIG